ncbi:MAG: hypothetical protein QNL91_02250 [Candidatus Krumholzibacteria bacterium]|nr:hypothetical protein [Candidatus Krumholzibacteria bacterium]
MSEKKMTVNHWAELESGFRGSSILRLGALATAGGALINLGAQVLAGAGEPSTPITIVAWLLFILGLWSLAGGFIWVGSHPFLTRFGFVVGALHAAQGIQLLLLLFTFTAVPIPPISFTVGRLLAIIIFVVVEKKWLGSRTRLLLGSAAGLLLTKAAGRALGYWPELGTPFEPLLDAMLLLYLTAGMLHLATAVRHQENDWAETVYNTGHADFSDFNNPEHEWNKAESNSGKRAKK